MYCDPCRGDVLDRVDVAQLGERGGAMVNRQSFGTAQQPTAVDQLDVDPAAAPSPLDPGDPLPHRIDLVVGLS